MQPMIPPKRFDIFPLTGGCSEGLGAFRFFFKYATRHEGKPSGFDDMYTVLALSFVLEL